MNRQLESVCVYASHAIWKGKGCTVNQNLCACAHYILFITECRSAAQTRAPRVGRRGSREVGECHFHCDTFQTHKYLSTCVIHGIDVFLEPECTCTISTRRTPLSVGALDHDVFALHQTCGRFEKVRAMIMIKK
ncbi:hypothetical protein EVAR_50796_1 [Eumeta japonica]|uniref:Uncharacterized protein n=1 Tax=Eumeta variegata TaxID=151549 RepID=A0A4C1XDC2_EUMVA|nr:hypothetical protein EVAR_50796_1 [Eumeta japonica]